MHFVARTFGEMGLFNDACSGEIFFFFFLFNLKPQLGIGFQLRVTFSKSGPTAWRWPGCGSGGRAGRSGERSLRCSTVTLAGRPGAGQGPGAASGSGDRPVPNTGMRHTSRRPVEMGWVESLFPESVRCRWRKAGDTGCRWMHVPENWGQRVQLLSLPHKICVIRNCPLPLS